MKYTFRIILILGFAVVIVLSFWLMFYYLLKHKADTQEKIESLVPPLKGQVTFRFLECAGKKAVFILENQTEHSIYARFQRVDYWKEWKDADVQLGLHLIDYKAPNSQSFEDISSRWDAVISFKEVPPHSFVRYGVSLSKEGEYKVRVPYMDNSEVAQRFDHNFVFKATEHFEKDFSSWQEVSSGVITNRCK